MKKVLSILMSVVMVFGVFGGMCSTVSAADGDVVTVKYEQTEARKMLSYINEFRSSGSWCWDETDTEKVAYPAVQKVRYDYDLEKSAMLRAAEISVYYEHTRPNGKSPFTTLTYYGTAGENIAYTEGFEMSAEHVFGLWREDDENYLGQGHRRNMLVGDFAAVGIACCYVNGRYYWVQEFRDVVVQPNPTKANDGYADVTIDYTGNVTPSLVGVKAPEVKVPTVTLTTPKKKSVKVAWNIQANVKNYQIKYSTNKNFKGAKTVTVGDRTASLTINKLKSKKKLYVKVRAKNKSTGKYTKWSKTKSIKVK